MTKFQNSYLAGKIFKQLLVTKNINPYQLARQAGIDKSYLSKLINGAIKKPGADKLSKIAQTLELQPSQLLALFNQPKIAALELELGEIELTQQQFIQYSRQDWGEAPDGSVCYGRKSELKTLQQWLIQERCRVIILYGLEGIGKTTLALQIAKQLQAEFDYILWRSLWSVPSPETIVTNVLSLTAPRQTFEAEIAQKISQLLFQLRQNRCLLILDRIESIFPTDNLTQADRDRYQIYGQLLRQIAQSEHQSCLILIGNEKPQELAILENASGAIRSFQVKGLKTEARQLLEDKQLPEPECWDDLVATYRGHPLALKIVATTIKEIFNGSVSEFLRQNTLFLGDLEFVIERLYRRLSQAEKNLLLAIAFGKKSVSIAHLSEQPNLQLPRSEIMRLLDSLKRRSLLEVTKENNQTVYTVQPLVEKYLNSYLFTVC